MPISRFIFFSSKHGFTHAPNLLQRFGPSKRIQSCGYVKSAKNGYRKPTGHPVMNVETQASRSWSAYVLPAALLGFGGLAAFVHYNDERRAVRRGNSSFWHSYLKLLLGPLWIIGIVISVFSFVGLIGACCKSNFFLWVYMFVLGIWIIGLVIGAVFMFYVASASSETQERAQKDWLETYYLVGKRWPAVKNCLVQGQVCRFMLTNASSLEEFKMEKTRYSIQDGCCRPPEDCGFEFKNATIWTVPKTGLVKKDGDCIVWNNQLDILCFDCDRCKEVFVADLRKDAMYFGISLAFELILVVITYSIGCRAKRNNERRYYPG